MSAPARSKLDGLAVGLVVLLCALWGVQQVASKVALSQGMPPFFQAVVRSALAGPLLVGWLALRQGRAGLRTLFAADGSLWPGLFSGVLFAAEFLALFPGVRLTTASRTVVLLFSGAFFTALGTHWFIPAERLRPVHWAGLVLAFAGVVATMSGGGGGGGGSLAGDGLVLLAAASWGFTTVLVKGTGLARIGSEKVLAYQLFGALPFLVGAALLSGELRMPEATGLAWWSLAYQVVVIAFASYLTWFWLVARYPAGRLSAFTFLTPLLGVAAAWLLLGETPTPLLGVGLLCVCAGLWLVNR